jgi:predicted Zn finger-like uncharacterized protein
MKIKCPNCSAAYDMDESRVPVAGVTIKCPRCQSPFRVTKQGVAASGATSSVPSTKSVPPPSVPPPAPPAAEFPSDAVPLPAPNRGGVRPAAAPPVGRPPGVAAPPAGRPPGAAAAYQAPPTSPPTPARAVTGAELPAPSFESTLPPGWGTTSHPAQQPNAPTARSPLTVDGLGEVVLLPSRRQPPAPTVAFQNPFDTANLPLGGNLPDPFAFTNPSPVAPPPPVSTEFDIDFGDAGGGAPPTGGAPEGLGPAAAFGEGPPKRAGDAYTQASNPFQAAVASAASRGMPGGEDSMLDFVDESAGAATTAGLMRWQIRRKSGKVFGPFDAAAVQAMLQQGQLFGNEDVSTDGENWKPLSTEPSLSRGGHVGGKPDGRGEPPGLAAPGTARMPAAMIPVMGGPPSSASRSIPAGTVPFEVTGAPPSKQGKGHRQMPVWGRLLMRRLPWLAAGAVVLVVVIGGVALGKTEYGYFGARLMFGRGVNGRSPAAKAIEQYDVVSAEGTFGSGQKAIGVAQEAVAQDADSTEAVMDYALISCRLTRRYGSAKADFEKARDLVHKRLDKSSVDGKVGLAAVAFCDSPGKIGDTKSMLDSISTDRRAELLYGDVLLAAKDFSGAVKHLDAVLKVRPSGEAAMLRADAAHALSDVPGEETALMKAQELVPGHARARLWLARLRVAQGKIDDASELLRSVLADPAVRALDASEEALGHHLRGDVLVAQRQFPEAIKEYLRAADGEPDNAKHRAAVALLELKLHHWADAVPAFDKALEKAPGDVVLLLGAGKALTATGNVTRATEKIEEARKKSPGDPAVAVTLGDLQVVLLHNSDAHKAYREALAKNDKYVPALVGEARLLLKEGKLDEARPRVDKAIEVAPKDPSAQAVYGRYCLATGAPAKAKEAFASAVLLEPDTSENLAGLGEALQSLGENAGAKDAYVKAVAIDPKDVFLRRQFALLLRQMNDLEGALVQLNAALLVDPNDARLQSLAGAVLLDLNRPTEAGVALKKAIGIKGDDALAYEYYGRLLALNGDTTQAVENLRRAVELEPKNSEIRYQLGLAYERGQLLVDATESFRQALALSPDLLDAYEHLASALSVQNFSIEAISTYKEVLKRDPKRASALGALGDTEFKAGLTADAVHHFEDAIKAVQKELTAKDESKRLDLDEMLASLDFKVGRAYEKKGDSDKAEKAYREAVRLEPKNASPYYYLGYIYKGYKGGPKRKDAIEAFESYLKYNKDAKDADEITDQIAYLRDGK